MEQLNEDIYNVEKIETDVSLEISVFQKNKNSSIAVIRCFFYNYSDPYSYSKKTDAIHIKSLGVKPDFLKKGIGTFLMKESILYAESKHVRHITVNPYASTHIISQEKLEEFYHNFTFSTFLNHSKKIKFAIVSD